MTFRRPAALVQRLSFNDFHIIEQVGEGTYGRVFKARNIHTNKLTALKVVFPTDDDEGLPFTAVREIKYLQMLSDNPNVIKLEGTFFTRDGELVLAFEYMENDLSGLLSLKNHPFTPAQTKCLFKQVLEGLHQCHRAGIMHRDIKAANLLLSHGQLKLADFGLASNYVRRRTFSTNVVTLWYRAPELLLGGTAYGPKVDIWSAGCLLIELLTRQSPFPGREEKHQLELIVQTCGTPDERNWPGVTKLEGYKQLLGLMGHKNRLREVFGKFEPRALNLLSKMLALNPADRPTASEALDHDYFWTDPLPCKATELPHYPAMHEYEAKKTRQSERQPKRQRVATHTSVNVPIAPLRLQPHSSSRQQHQGYPPHIPLPMPQITRGDYPPYPSKPGLQYGQPPARQNPPVSMQGWGSSAHGAHLQATSDGLLPTPHVPLPTLVHPSRSTGYMGTAYPGSLRPSAAAPSSAQHHDAMRSAVSQQSHATSATMASARHSQSQSQRHRTSAQSAMARVHGSQQSAALLATPSSTSSGMSVRGGPYAAAGAARNGERYHDGHREMHRPPAPPTSSRVPYSSLGGGPHVDDSVSSSYNRPPAGAHRSHPHQHAQHPQQHHLRSSSLMHQHDGHASAPYAVHTNMGHARQASLMHAVGGGHDVTGKRKRPEAVAPLL